MVLEHQAGVPFTRGGKYGKWEPEGESLNVYLEKSYGNMVTMGWRVVLLVKCLP